jgi:hypothetical protein
MGRLGKNGVRLLGKFWQKKEPATTQVKKAFQF